MKRLIFGLLISSLAFGSPSITLPVSGGGGGTGNILSINADVTAAQLLTVGATGTDFAIVDDAAGGHAFNLPSASATARGLVSTGAQTLAGVKTFSSAPVMSSLTASLPVKTTGGSALTAAAISLSGAEVTGTLPANSVANVTNASNHVLTGYSSGAGTVASTDTLLAAIQKINGNDALKAPLASPTFTGTVTLPSGSVTSSAWDTGSSTFTSNGVAFTAKAPLASPAFTTQVTFGNYHIEPCENDSGNSGTTKTLDLSTCSVQKSTLTGSVTYTLSNPVTGGAYLIKIATGAGSFTVTWPGTVKWSGGTAPTITATASKVDLVNLYWDGTSYYGSFTQNY